MAVQSAITFAMNTAIVIHTDRWGLPLLGIYTNILDHIYTYNYITLCVTLHF
jgi:hypothetical protein